MMSNRALPNAADPIDNSSNVSAADILRQRAAALAQRPQESLDATDVLEMIQFRIGREAYAIETKYVEEVIKGGSLTRIPESASVLEGVMNLRGEILAVMNLGLLLHSELANPTDAWIIVIGQERTEFGVSIDSVTEVATIPVRDILPATKHLDGTDSLVCGVTAEALTIIDGAALLADQRLYIDSQ